MIVESPAKAKTIEGYLGSDFAVLASYGHVRDLPKSKLGVDVENDFEPTYIVATKSKKNVTAIKNSAKTADLVYLATDLDREGEAIAWHVMQAAGLGQSKNVRRITFSEISKTAILEAIKNPRDIDMNLVDAQQARRVLDRLVGYNLSPLLWRKIYKGLSAGRVQSVAVRLVVEREREIENFKAQEYWTVTALLEKQKKEFEARLIEAEGKKIEKLAIQNEKQAGEILKKLENGKYVVTAVEDKEERRNPLPPFTTSTMQQEAANNLGFSAKQTMRLAQGLYESGLITYMRTDSVNFSQNATGAIREYVKKTCGESYLPSEARRYQTKSKHAQEAHEAVRPVDIAKLAGNLGGAESQQIKLYDLVWRRTICSQMKEAILAITDVKIENKGFIFTSRGQMVKFDGFLKFYPQKITQTQLPKLSKGDEANLVDLKREQHFTEPPARYSEATLIRALEENGIGRPSTYAPTMSTIQDRGYVIKEKGRLRPEKVGVVVNDLLVENFPDVVDFSFTAHVEDDLDEIAEGKQRWQKVINDFYVPFEKLLKERSEKIEKTTMDETLEETCPDCGKSLIIKHSRRGKFIGCSSFPDCRYTRSFIEPAVQAKIDAAEEIIKEKKCPNCKKSLKVINGKFGPFIGCTGYPECKYMEKINNGSRESHSNQNRESSRE